MPGFEGQKYCNSDFQSFFYVKNRRNPSEYFHFIDTVITYLDFKCTYFIFKSVSNFWPSKPNWTKGLIFFIGAEAKLIYPWGHNDMVEYNSYILMKLIYLICALFFPLGWKFCVSNVLWNWSLRLETGPNLQFKRSQITPRKRYLFVSRSGSLYFIYFVFIT